MVSLSLIHVQIFYSAISSLSTTLIWQYMPRRNSNHSRNNSAYFGMLDRKYWAFLRQPTWTHDLEETPSSVENSRYKSVDLQMIYALDRFFWRNAQSPEIVWSLWRAWCVGSGSTHSPQSWLVSHVEYSYWTLVNFLAPKETWQLHVCRGGAKIYWYETIG